MVNPSLWGDIAHERLHDLRREAARQRRWRLVKARRNLRSRSR